MAAQDAELKLKVSLDLAFFRAQLSRLPIEAAGYTAPVNLRINNKSIVDEFRRVSNYLGRKEYKIKITSETLEKLTEKVGKFQKQLQLLKDEKIAVDVQASVNVANINQKQVRKIRAQIRQDILSQGGQIELEAKIATPSTSNFVANTRKKVKEQLGKAYTGGAIPVETQLKLPAISDFLKAIQKNLNKNPVRVIAQVEQRTGVRTGAASQVKTSPIDASTRTFRQELLGIGDIDKIQGIYKAAAKQGLVAFDEGITGNKRKMIDALSSAARDAGQGFLDAFENEKSALSKAAKEYGQTLLKGLKKTLRSASPSLEMWEIGHDAGKGFELGLLEALEIAEKSAVRQTRSMLDRLARMVLMMSGMSGVAINQQVRDMRGLKPVSFPSSAPQKDIPIGPSGTGRALPPASMQALAGLISGARPPAGLLPSITPRSSIKSGIETLFAAGGPQFPMGPSGKLAMSAEALKARVDKILTDYFKVVEVTIKEVFTQEDLKRELNRFSYLPQALRDAELRTKQARVGIPAAQGIAGLLPPAVGRAPNVYATDAIGGESRQQMMARRTAEAYVRSALRGTSVLSERQTALPGTTFMGDAFVSGGGRDRVTGGGQPPQRGGAIVPYAPSTRLPEGYFEGARKYSAALDMARGTMAKFSAGQLPLIGGLKEIGGEFAMATKQVLLYGTAYRGLAFITSLPGQILNAAKSQQQFGNALQTATQDTGTFAKELLYVDNVQRAFGLNLETTRTGFTKLYASMAPTGFDSGSIEKLFTGISAATAALQLTPDKAERVIYAFGQMASKGQIMSEELKGQLGDVLPGALALFADAAGMSVKEFSAAMEKGEFVGSKFRDTFAKVSDELMKRFGTGAQAAGKSLQGLINTVQGDFARTLESFSPLANAAAQAILVPLGGALKQLSISAQLATGELERTFTQLQQAQKDLTSAKAGGDLDQIRGAEQSVAALTVRYKALQQAAADPAIAKQTKDIQLFTEELTKAGTFVMNVAKTIGGILSPILSILGTNLTTVISLLTSFYIGFQTARLAAMALMGVLLTYRTLSAILGFGPAALGANALAAAFNGLGVAATGAQIKVVGLRTALIALTATTVIGAVVAGVLLVAGAFATMRDRAKEASQASLDAAQSAIEAAKTGNVAQAAMGVQNILAESRAAQTARRTLDAIYARATKEQKKGIAPMQITPEEAVALQGSALTSGMIQAGITRSGRREIRVPSKQEMEAITQQFGSLAGTQKIQYQEAQSALALAQQRNKQIGFNRPTPSAVTEPPGTEQAGGKALKDFTSDKVRILQRQLELSKAYIAQQIELTQRQREINTADAEYVLGLRIIAAQYEEAKRQANEFKKEQRAGALQEAENFKLIDEQELLFTYRKALLGDLIGLSDKYEIQINDLNDSIKALTGGQEKANESSKLEADIKRLLSQLNKEQLALVQPILDKLRTQAKLVDTLTEREKALADAREKAKKLEENIKNTLSNLRNEIELLRTVNDEEARRLRIAQEYEGATKEQLNKIYDLEKIRDNIKTVRELIDSFVTDTTSDYKNFLSEIISGKDAGDALREFQKSLKDRVLKIFLDFSMAPVEKFFKESLNQFALDKLFPKADIEKTPEETKKETALEANTAALNRLTDTITTPAVSPDVPQTPGNGPVAIPVIPFGANETTETLAQTFANDASLFVSSISSVDSSLKDATIGIANAAEEASPNGATGKKWQQSLGAAVQGIGIAAGSIMGIMAGIQQVKEGGTSNVLGGIGSILLSVGGAIGGLSSLGGLFGGGGGGAGDVAGNLAKAPFAPKLGPVFANGGIAKGGFRAFANGGIVQGPTLGLVGEGLYNEAVVPLPNGKSIPVQLGGRTARDLMGGNAPGMPQQTSLNMSFETTKINGVEYVSRDQLEQAMAETRRASISGGARQGMAMTLDKIRQSPSTRSRIGMR